MQILWVTLYYGIKEKPYYKKETTLDWGGQEGCSEKCVTKSFPISLYSTFLWELLSPNPKVSLSLPLNLQQSYDIYHTAL